MSELYSALEDARLRREAQNLNATRPASCVLTFDTTGVGESTTGALDFGMAFTEPPALATGAVALALPDTASYRYPTISAGVWKWATRPGSNLNEPLYTGAFLFFVVQCDPRTILRTNGDDQDYWRAQRTRLETELARLQRIGQASGAEYLSLLGQLKRSQAQLQEAQLAAYLQAHPPQVAIRHHLTFTGVAAQAYSLDPAFTQPVSTVPVTFF